MNSPRTPRSSWWREPRKASRRFPLLAITSNDQLAPQTDALVAAIKAKGGKVTAVHMDTDHSYSDHRIALESAVITWLSGLN